MNIGFPPPCDITICITIISPTKLCAPQKTHYWFCFILIISYCADQNSLLVLDAINLTSDSVPDLSRNQHFSTDLFFLLGLHLH